VPARPSRQQTLAVLIDHIDHQPGNYEGHLRMAFDAECRKLDLTLLMVVGRGLGDPVGARAAHNSIYDLIHPDCVDGIILLSAGLAMHAGPESIRRLCEKHRGLPMCSLGLRVPGIPSVLFDNRAGLKMLLDHLIQEHGCRRLAFLTGPAENPDAQIRLETYRTVLTEHGILFDPSLVLAGEFTMHDARAATLVAIDRGLRCDAMVAANDGMALGALQALHSRGMRVPRDIKLTGFNDVVMARVASPPLTTVRQPLERMATLAVRWVVEQIAGKDVPSVIELAADFVPRRSCGCGSPSTRRSLRASARALLDPSGLVRQRSSRLQGLLDRSLEQPGEAPSSWAQRLLTALERELDDEEGIFISTLEEVLEEVGEENHRYEQFQVAITVLRDELGCLSSPDLETLWHDARRLISSRTLASRHASGWRWTPRTCNF
jgi:DNA-binding LacI/PurR family transcriptional regulator